jgi:hypothetical protein
LPSTSLARLAVFFRCGPERFCFLCFFRLLLDSVGCLVGSEVLKPGSKTFEIGMDTAAKLNFRSDDGLISVFTTTKPRRFPPHNFPVVVLQMRAKPGTRVLRFGDGMVEYMPRYGEVAALCAALGVTFPARLKDKPDARRLHYQQINAARFLARNVKRTLRVTD